jgi:hypothetical protein
MNQRRLDDAILAVVFFLAVLLLWAAAKLWLAVG